MSGQRSKLRVLVPALLGFVTAVGSLKLWSFLEHRASERAVAERPAHTSNAVARPPASPASVFVGPSLGDGPAKQAAAEQPGDEPAAASAPATEPPGKTDDEVAFEVEQRFQAQRPATGKSVELSKALDTAFRARSDVRVGSVECREVLCKVGLGFQNAIDAKEVLDELLVYGPFRQYASMIPSENESPGSFEVTLYVAREGEVLSTE